MRKPALPHCALCDTEGVFDGGASCDPRVKTQQGLCAACWLRVVKGQYPPLTPEEVAKLNGEEVTDGPPTPEQDGPPVTDQGTEDRPL